MTWRKVDLPSDSKGILVLASDINTGTQIRDNQGGPGKEGQWQTIGMKKLMKSGKHKGKVQFWLYSSERVYRNPDQLLNNRRYPGGVFSR